MADSRRVLVTGGAGFVGATLVRQVLGYAPTISREDGIRQTWQWFRESVFGP